MRIFKRLVITAFFVAAMLVAGQPMVAKDAVIFTKPVEAYRQGVKAYKADDITSALQAFEFASGKGVLGAQLRLARMYALGDKVEKDHSKAFVQYQRIVLNFSDLAQDHAGAKYVAEAFVALGGYYELGIESFGMKADKAEAAGHYRYAASYFRNPVAQFRLARLYLKGEGVAQNVRIAAKWLHVAAKKGHAPSQAVLAQLLWQGGPVKKRSVQALALLDLAIKSARKSEREWIGKLRKKIFDQAQPEDVKKAAVMLAGWRTRYGSSARNIVGDEALVGKPKLIKADAVAAQKDGAAADSGPRTGFTNVGTEGGDQ